jgi:hypothetical protein
MKTAEETHNLLREGHGDDALSQTTIYERFECSKNGSTSTDDKRSGRISTLRSEPLIAQVKNKS